MPHRGLLRPWDVEQLNGVAVSRAARSAFELTTIVGVEAGLVAVNRLQAMIPVKEDRSVKPETWANIAAFLGNSVMVLHHEKLNVITSKMFGARPTRL